MNGRRQPWIAGFAGLTAAGLWAVLAIAQQGNSPPNRQLPRQQTPRTPETQQAPTTPQIQPGAPGGFQNEWAQVAELHRQIVRSELVQIEGAPARPFNQPGAAGSRNAPAAAQSPGANINPAGVNAPGNPAVRAGQGSRSDALWLQFAQKHQQLVQMRAGGQRPLDQANQPNVAQPGVNLPGANQPDAIPPRTSQPDVIPPGVTDANVTGPSSGDLRYGPPVDQLERELGQIYLQILNIDIAEAYATQQVARPDLEAQNPAGHQLPQLPRPQQQPQPRTDSPNN